MAVFTTLSPATIAAVVDCFGLGELISADAVEAGSRSTIYRVAASSGTWILRLIETDRFEGEVREELAFIRALRRRGLPVPEVRARVDGRGDSMPLEGGELSVYSTVPGTKVSERRECIPRVAESLARAVARMHRVGRGRVLRRRRALTVEAMRPVVAGLRSELSTRAMAHMEEIDAAADRVSRAALDELPRGILHNDLFPDNVFVDGDRLSGIIDFGECLDGPLVHDLAVLLNQWGFDRRTGSYRPAVVASLLRGYQTERALRPEEIAALPAALDRAALTFVYVRLLLFERGSGFAGEEKDFRHLLPMLRADKQALADSARRSVPGEA